jgi:hypothetical protein
MAGLVPAIHVFIESTKDVDARAKRGHDDQTTQGPARVDPRHPAAIKYLTVPPGEAAHFVSADCRLVDE